MKRAILLLSLFLVVSCASNDGFVTNQVNSCGPNSPIGIDAGWEQQSSPIERGQMRMTLLVQVSNSSDKDITVKRVRAEPMPMERDSMYEIQGGAQDFDKLIAQGEDSTFEIPMMSMRRLQERTTGVRASGVDVAVTVGLDSEESVRCRFRLPLGF
jgi:hypothetical protein